MENFLDFIINYQNFTFMCLIWIVCGIVSVILKKEDAIGIAMVATILFGIYKLFLLFV